MPPDAPVPRVVGTAQSLIGARDMIVFCQEALRLNAWSGREI